MKVFCSWVLNLIVDGLMIWCVFDWWVFVELCCKGELKRLFVIMLLRVKDVKLFDLLFVLKEVKCLKLVYIIYKFLDMKDFDKFKFV